MPSHVKNPKMASKRITWLDSLKLPPIDEPPVLPMIFNRIKKITFDDETAAPFSLPFLFRGANPPFLSRITNNIGDNDDNNENNINNNELNESDVTN